MGRGRIKIGPNHDNRRVSLDGFTELVLSAVPEHRCTSIIGSAKKLEALTIDGTNVTYHQLDALKTHKDTLVALELCRCILVLDRKAALALASLTKLQSLTVDEVVIDGAAGDVSSNDFTKLTSLLSLKDRSDELLALLPLATLTEYHCRNLLGSTLELLKPARNLEVLVAERYEVDDQRFAILARFQQLRRLELRNNPNLLRPPKQSLAELKELGSLETLLVGELPVDFDELATTLSELTMLTTLTISFMEVTESGLAVLGQSKSLQKVRLDNCTSLTANGLVELCRALTIHDLDIESCTGLSSDAIRGLGRGGHLTRLVIPVQLADEPRASDADKANTWSDRLLSCIAANSFLKTVTVPRNTTASGLRAIYKHKGVETLDLRRAEAMTLGDLRFLSGLPVLQCIMLSEDQAPAGVAEVLSQCVRMEHLRLEWHDSIIDGMLDLLDGLPEIGLRSLHISMKNAGGKQLARAIARLKSVETLVVQSDTGCSVDMISHLSRLPRLTKLGVDVKSEHDSLEVVNALGSLKTLSELDLGAYSLTDEALTNLTNSLDLSSLHFSMVDVSESAMIRICRERGNLELTGSR
ncbi:MAG: hypothetical protein K8I27_12710 [Planctomycetes bacterium]|nr:hypothetical protein [Planctomycetota bacterium]